MIDDDDFKEDLRGFQAAAHSDEADAVLQAGGMIAAALMHVAEALHGLAMQTRRVAHGDAFGPSGLESLTMQLRESAGEIASALRNQTDTAQALSEIADKLPLRKGD